MKWKALLAIAGTFVSLTTADILDLGSLDQYKPKLTAAPADIIPSGIWIGQGNGGLNIALGQDVLSKVQGVLQSCGTIDNKCYQDVNRVFDAADVQIDKQLDRRGFASLLSKTFKSSIGFFLDISAYLLASWQMKSQDVNELGMWLPDAVASDAGALASITTITISGGGAVVATITKVPDTISLVGSAAPAITSVTAPKNGYVVGDLAALLDKGLASRIDEYMHRVGIDCKDGKDFDSQNPFRKRAGGGTYGQAICAAEAVIGAASQGAFHDLLLLNPTQLPFGFADTAGVAFRAANVVADFVNAYAPLIAAPPALAEQLAVYIFALAIDTIVELTPLGSENRIASSQITTGTATRTSASASSTSSSACPNPTTLTCGIAGGTCPIKLPDNGQTSPTCKDGPNKDCECIAPSIVAVNIMSSSDQKTLVYLSNLLILSKASAPAAAINHPACPIVVTDMPANVFSSDQNKIYPQYCQAWNAKQVSNMTVDSTGKNRNPTKKMKRKRTPPPNAATYSNWNFDLGFTPSGTGGDCSTDCNGAYAQIASVCASNADGVYMYEQGTFDVGCGVFSYKVYKPTTALKEFNQFCYRVEDFAPLGGDVTEYQVRTLSQYACAGSALDKQKIKAGQKETFIQFYTNTNGAPYQYNVWWIDGCKLDDNGPTEVSAANPLMIANPGNTICQDTLYQNWKNCNNKGVGGNVQVGCLMYEFKADANKRVF